MTTTFCSLAAANIPESGMLPSEQIPREAFTTDSATESIFPFYQSEDGTVAAGIWDCDPCLLEVPAYPVNEMMTVVSGSMTLTDSEGNAVTYGPGDSLFVPKGSPFTFQVNEKTRKYFMTSA